MYTYLFFLHMQVATQKDITKNKKPIQVYFEQETVFAINKMANQQKIPVAEYIRNTIIKDLQTNKKQKKHKFKTFDLGGNLTNKEIDAIIYKI